MEHDQLIKELITTFFREFIALFFPKLAAHLDPEFSFVPLQQEIFDDIERKERHVVDLLMQGKFQGHDACFLIHVENQATAQSDFPQRMFEYFARLTLRHKLPVYPIVVFSYGVPRRAEPSQYVVTFPNKTVMRFDYDVIQLNRIPWRRFLKSDNPVATGLMAKMKIAVKDRPKARAELLRVLVRQRLDPARTRLLGVFIDRYLTLTEAETKQFERVLSGFGPEERQETMEIMSSWERKGMEQGLHDGKVEMAMQLIRKRFDSGTEEMEKQVTRLSSEQLNELGKALFDFTGVTDLERWLARR